MPTKKTDTAYLNDFQTPPPVCKYMVSLLPPGVKTICEPTPGEGNLVRALSDYDVITFPDYFAADKKQRFDAIVMNPPFSTKTAFGVPANFKKVGMGLGYHILNQCMEMTDNVIALMPMFTISDSDRRQKHLKNYGLISITALPRKTFQYARIQTVVLQLQHGYLGPTEYKVFGWHRSPDMFK